MLLYQWTDGIDAVQAMQAGLLSGDQVERMTQMVRQELAGKGWVVLDHKPRHIIVRPIPAGTCLLSRHGKPAWALIDYELLFPM